jgi:hypothetical protein
MLTRRDTLRAAALAGAGAVLSLAPAAALAFPPRAVALIDPRFPEAGQFSAIWRAAACDVVHVTHDADPLWREFQHRWKTDPVPLIGLARRSTFVLFTQLAAASGLRLAFHGRRGVTPEGRTGYRLTATATCCDVVEHALKVSGDWAAALGAAVTAAARQRERGQQVTRTLVTATSSATPSKGLVLWALVPVAGRIQTRRS